MRNLILILFIFLPGGMVAVAQQHSIQQASAHYMRVDPLDRPFSTFLNQVMNDSDFVVEQKRLRSDSGLFYLRGHYKKFNPFHFKTERVQLVLFEQDVSYDSVTNWRDTLFVGMLTAVPVADKKDAEKMTRSEFDWCSRKFGKDFVDHQTSQLEEEGKLAGELTDYYTGSPIFVPPMSIYWGSLVGDKSRNGFGFLLRLKIFDNRADLPIPSDRR